MNFEITCCKCCEKVGKVGEKSGNQQKHCPHCGAKLQITHIWEGSQYKGIEISLAK